MGFVYEINIQTTEKEQVIDVTSRVQEIITSLKIKEGFVCLYVPHSTAAITIHKKIENEQNSTLTQWLNKLDQNNPSPHMIKAAIIAPTEVLIIKNGKLEMDEDQRIYFYEFEGPKERKILVYVTE